MFRNVSTLLSVVTDFIHIDWSDSSQIETDSVGRPKGAMPVDQFDAQPFMMGENGFRRSDIAILMNAESDDLKRAVAARLEEINSQFPDQSLTDSELAAMAIPRSCQSASMMRDWYSSLDKSGLAMSVDEYVKANTPKEDSHDSIKFGSQNSES